MLIAIGLSITLIVADYRFRHLDQARAVLSILVYPIIYGASAAWVTDVFDFRTNLTELDRINQQLRQENLLLQARLQQLDALEAENMRLRDLLGSSFKVGDRVLIAELISVDLDPYRQQIMINKGTSSGVFVGQPVLDAHAVVGQVIHVTPSTAIVLLITDPVHALPVQINRNGLRTIAEGTSFIEQLNLPYVANNADIKVGDLLVTSGLGGHFPPGYPVAIVSEIRHEPGKPFAKVIATPSAHLQRIREVLLVWSLNLERVPDAAEPEDGTSP
ncbi:rod shape-determining protein MreC [Achromatium sp. WMS2]|nr:rod shape-determining protein MreC [Achromatium sp. WMS2]